MMQNNSLAVSRIFQNTFVLYRSHFKSYLGITLRSGLWSSAIFLLFLAFTGLTLVLFSIVGSIINQGSPNWILVGLLLFFLTIGLLVALFYSSFFCVGKSLMNLAVISRLAYQELAQKPETPRSTRQQISTRHWQFCWMHVLVGLLLAVVNVGLQALQVFVLLPASSIFGGESATVIILNLVLDLVSYGIYLWFYAHLFISEVPLAVENNLTSSSAIERSWNLSKRNVFQIVLAIFVAGLITIPLYFAVFFLVFAPLIPAILVAIQSNDWSTLAAQTSLIFSIASAFLRYIFLSIIIGLLIAPFWQVIKGVIYYQLQCQHIDN
ncbi:MAG: hypothetical protein VKK42_13395 [Lyngbya sp.]|nr:hypothetical protein [Lyngbya sp.]